MKISIQTVERALKIVIEEYKSLHGQIVDIDSDFYWTVMSPAKYSIYEKPSPVLGSLEQHAELVDKVAKGEWEPSTLMLADIGEILKHLAEAEVRGR